MSKKNVCDLTGKEIKGDPVTELLVPITDSFALQVTPMQKTGANAYVSGDLCEEAADKVKAAVESLKKGQSNPSPPAK